MANPTQLSDRPDGLPAPLEPTDEALVARAVAGDPAAFELLMRRNNQRVYRTIRSILRDGSEVEDAMQQAYLSAFTHLHQFQGTSRFSTWLCRIAFHEALARVRQQHGRFVSIDTSSEGSMAETLKAPSADPEREAGSREVALILESAVDRLPDIYRAVLVLRQIEGLTTAETAEILDVEEEVVKTRLHRARALLRTALEQRMGEQLDEAYSFGAERCDRIVAMVMARIKQRA
jgi:RNA polymerase sigma-70 factor (ECF subfamily)